MRAKPGTLSHGICCDDVPWQRPAGASATPPHARHRAGGRGGQAGRRGAGAPAQVTGRRPGGLAGPGHAAQRTHPILAGCLPSRAHPPPPARARGEARAGANGKPLPPTPNRTQPRLVLGRPAGAPRAGVPVPGATRGAAGGSTAPCPFGLFIGVGTRGFCGAGGVGLAPRAGGARWPG